MALYVLHQSKVRNNVFSPNIWKINAFYYAVHAMAVERYQNNTSQPPPLHSSTTITIITCPLHTAAIGLAAVINTSLISWKHEACFRKHLHTAKGSTPF